MPTLANHSSNNHLMTLTHISSRGRHDQISSVPPPQIISFSSHYYYLLTSSPNVHIFGRFTCRCDAAAEHPREREERGKKALRSGCFCLISSFVPMKWLFFTSNLESAQPDSFAGDGGLTFHLFLFQRGYLDRNAEGCLDRNKSALMFLISHKEQKEGKHRTKE
jgi:hypothetical protein